MYKKKGKAERHAALFPDLVKECDRVRKEMAERGGAPKIDQKSKSYKERLENESPKLIHKDAKAS